MYGTSPVFFGLLVSELLGLPFALRKVGERFNLGTLVESLSAKIRLDIDEVVTMFTSGSMVQLAPIHE